VGLADIMPGIQALGSLGFAIWFAYYATTKLIPDQQREHRDTVKEIVAAHAKTLEAVVTEMKLERETFSVQLSLHREGYDRWKTISVAEQQNQREAYDRWRHNPVMEQGGSG
jgi:hypothetical protein